MIHFEDQMTFDLPIEKAREYLNDKEMMAKSIPTLKSYKVVDDDHVEGIVKITLGLLPVESRVSLEVVERDAPVKVRAKGISYLGESISSLVKEVKPGAVNKDSVGIFTVQVELTKLGPSQTHVKAFVEVDAAGKLKRVYDSIMEKKLPTLRADFVVKVQAMIAERISKEKEAQEKDTVGAGLKPAPTIVLPQATDKVSYSFFGRIIAFFINLLDRMLQRGEQLLRP